MSERTDGALQTLLVAAAESRSAERAFAKYGEGDLLVDELAARKARLARAKLLEVGHAAALARRDTVLYECA